MAEGDAPPSEDVVAVGHAYGPMEAAIAFSLLDAAGILAHVQTRNAACNAWQYMTAFGGMAILVPASQAADAHKILADFDPSPRRWPRMLLILGALTTLAIAVPLPNSGFAVLRLPPVCRAE